MKQCLYLLSLFVLLLLLFACSSNEDTRPRPSVFHYNQPNNITSLDPAFARSQNNIWAIDHLYNGLVQLNDQLEVVPAIAKRWTISPDGRSYTFHLREGVYFHDDPAFEGGKGRSVVASDVVYSLERILDTVVNSPGSWIFEGKVRAQKPFEALDDSPFVLHLQQAFRPMLGILTMQYCAIVAPEIVKHYGAQFRSHPIGTGPFRLKRWLENQALFLQPHPKYFEASSKESMPYLDGLRLSFISDRKTAFLELIKGKIDFISGLESSFINELLTPEGQLQAKQRARLQMIKSPYLNTEYLGINMATLTPDHPLSHKAVRQALNYAIDRRSMLRALRNTIGRPAKAGFIPAGLPSYAPDQVKGYSYQPETACV